MLLVNKHQLRQKASLTRDGGNAGFLTLHSLSNSHISPCIEMCHSHVAILILVCYSCISTSQVNFQKSYRVALRDYGYSAQQTSDGGYIIVGFTETAIGIPYNEVYLIKTNSA